MEKAPVDFRQQRDFGEVFNATFTFIGQEIKPLGKVILLYVLPFLLVAAILGVFVNIGQQKNMNLIRSGSPEFAENPFGMLGTMYKYIFLLMIVYLAGLSALRCAIYGYIKLYVVRGKGQFSQADVLNEIKKYILPVMGSSLLIGIMVGFGMLLCLVPGVWLGVSLSMIFIALVFEGNGFSNAFNRSFSLTKLKWWLTLGIIIVAYLIVYMIAMFMSIPNMILGFSSVFSSFKNLEEPAEINFPLSFYIISSITSLVTYILCSIPYIALAFQYFSLVEMKERPSLGDRIEQIG